MSRTISDRTKALWADGRRAGANHHQFGKPHSAEARAKISEGLKAALDRTHFDHDGVTELPEWIAALKEGEHIGYVVTAHPGMGPPKTRADGRKVPMRKRITKRMTGGAPDPLVLKELLAKAIAAVAMFDAAADADGSNDEVAGADD